MNASELLGIRATGQRIGHTEAYEYSNLALRWRMFSGHGVGCSEGTPELFFRSSPWPQMCPGALRSLEGYFIIPAGSETK